MSWSVVRGGGGGGSALGVGFSVGLSVGGDGGGGGGVVNIKGGWDAEGKLEAGRAGVYVCVACVNELLGRRQARSENRQCERA
jgi:hypothetical protein